MSFKVGDHVTWTSQSAGVTRAKVGEVIEVVPPQTRPKRRLSTFGLPRNHESYVVLAIAVRPNNRTRRIYWPRVSKLEIATEENIA